MAPPPPPPPQLLLLLTMLLPVLTASAANVSYDHRAIIVDGQRRILISGCIHYPRATPLMWPGLIHKAKQGGLDMIDTYVFWDGHEPSPGTYNFQGRYDLLHFLKLVQEAGLFVNLRIGPYVCAEWNLGGFPAWLLKVPDIQFRTNNEPFKNVMERFVKKVVSMVKSESLFASQGGPVVFAQIENEYGNVQGSYGQDGRAYMLWAARMARELETGVPWIMCQQSDAPEFIINTCNGYYCDGWKPNSGRKPKIWTENWSGWFQSWGEAVPYRPVEDVAFAVARFFQRGGVVQNYYMYFGGTNFGRTSGGPYITTSYDYDAPLDEFGLIRQPKWGHLKELHSALKLCEYALTSNDPRYYSLGRLQEAHVYMDRNHLEELSESSPCAAFLANIDTSTASVKFNGRTYELPPWSVSILPDCRNVVFNTAKVNAQLSEIKMNSADSETPQQILQASSPNRLAWNWYREPVGSFGNISAYELFEQLKVTNDTTDYLWYSTSLQISEMDMVEADPVLSITSMRDMVHIFINGELTGTADTLTSSGMYASVQQPIRLKVGENQLALLSTTVGLQNYGAHLETWGAGILGSVGVQGLSTGTKDLTSALWSYQVGLQGEKLHVYSNATASWSSSVSVEEFPVNQPLFWYKANFDNPGGSDPVAVYLGSMSKGEAWVNGHSLGRIWPAIGAPTTGCAEKCDYRGAYSSSKCLSRCGHPSQQWYHVPREWLNREGENTLVLFEEVGGNVSGVLFATRVVDRICGVISEYSLPPVVDSTGLPEMRLSCDPGQVMTSIVFSSFGNPQGSCGKFKRGSCHAVQSGSVVEEACLGKQSCSVIVFWEKFGGDACPGKAKSLAVEAACSSSSSSSDEWW